MSRRTASLGVFALVLLALFILVPDVLLTIFAGLLLAVLLRSAGGWISDRLGLATGWGIAIVLVLIVAFLAMGTLTFADDVTKQVDELSQKIPEAIDNVRERLDDYSWGKTLLDHATPEGLISAGGGRQASAAISGTFGALGNFVVILIIGIYGAIDPRPYRRGLLALFAPSIRPRAGVVLDHSIGAMRNWISAQLISMSVVGVLTGLGLWAIGVPLAFILGLIAGLLAFIPNIGPILSITPALLLAFVDGWQMLLWVLGVYVVVQTLESYVITPLVQQEKVSVPAGFVIAVQLLFGVLFGLMGLALAMPLAAVGLTLVREVYVGDYLEGERGPRPD